MPYEPNPVADITQKPTGDDVIDCLDGEDTPEKENATRLSDLFKAPEPEKD